MLKEKILDWLSNLILPDLLKFISKFIKGYLEEKNEEIYENRIVNMNKPNR